MKKQEEQNRYIEVRLRLALKQEIKNTYVMIVSTSNYFATKLFWLNIIHAKNLCREINEREEEE